MDLLLCSLYMGLEGPGLEATETQHLSPLEIMPQHQTDLGHLQSLGPRKMITNLNRGL